MKFPTMWMPARCVSSIARSIERCGDPFATSRRTSALPASIPYAIQLMPARFIFSSSTGVLIVSTRA